MRSDRPAKLGQSAAIQVDHLALAGGFEFGKAAAKPEARIVDERFDLLAGGIEVAHQRSDCPRLRQVDLDRAGIAELGRESVEAVLAASRKDQPLTLLRKLPREFDSKPSRGPGNQRDAAMFSSPAGFRP